MLLFSCANSNFLFGRLSNHDCQIVHPALVSGPPNRKKPYNKHLISLVFSVRTVNYGSSFFSKSMEKNSVRNLQYRPKTRLIRGMYRPPIRLITGYIDAFLEPLSPMSSLFALYELLIGSNNFGTK